MTRQLPVVAALALSLAACGSTSLLPDGGRVRSAGCSSTRNAIGVYAYDEQNQPVSGADVTATNRTNGKVQTGRTGGDGRTTQITDDIGDGQIAFTATNGFVSTKQPFIVNVTCGECDCTATPSTATLLLQ